MRTRLRSSEFTAAIKANSALPPVDREESVGLIALRHVTALSARAPQRLP